MRSVDGLFLWPLLYFQIPLFDVFLAKMIGTLEPVSLCQSARAYEYLKILCILPSACKVGNVICFPNYF